MRCWLFGHKEEWIFHNRSAQPVCIRCLKVMEYDDFVMNSRWERLVDFFKYWLFRKWFPEKCYCCGHRYEFDESVDHIPF
jgi:hypothetical protein